MIILKLVHLLTVLHTTLAALSTQELFQRRAAAESGLIAITSSEFNSFFNGPKDYFLITMFTTNSDQLGCTPCKLFLPAYKTISESIIADYPQKPIFFTVAEFENNQREFQKLQMNTVPHVWIYPPTPLDSGNDEDDSEEQEQLQKIQHQLINVTSDHYQFPIPELFLDDQKELELKFGNFLSSVLHLNILIHRPFEIDVFVRNFLIYLAIFVILKKRGRKIWTRLQNSHVYFLVSCALIFVSTSGYNFCIQRSVPFIAKNDQGGIMYFSGGTQYQFGLEILNVSSIYTVLTGLMIVLVTFVPSVPNKGLQSVLALVGLLLIFVVYNFLNSVFLIKDPDYPFTQWRLI